MKTIFPNGKLPHDKEEAERIERKDIHLSGSSWLPKRSDEKTGIFGCFYSETGREWFVGRVLEVHFEKGYFEAQVKDTKGKERTAEFAIDKVFEDCLDLEHHLFPGAKFVFSVGMQYKIEKPVL